MIITQYHRMMHTIQIFIVGKFGPNPLYCEISDDFTLSIIFTFFWLFVGFVLMCYFLIRVKWAIRRRLTGYLRSFSAMFHAVNIA